jgi:hypothetical protein
MKYQAALICTAALISGCASQQFVMSGDTEESPTEQTSQAFFVNGIGQHRVIDAAAVCGGADKVQKVEVQETFVNGVFRFITFGIYTPRDAKIYCKK